MGSPPTHRLHGLPARFGHRRTARGRRLPAACAALDCGHRPIGGRPSAERGSARLAAAPSATLFLPVLRTPGARGKGLPWPRPTPRKQLPTIHPRCLRKQAKRRAKQDAIQLAGPVASRGRLRLSQLDGTHAHRAAVPQGTISPLSVPRRRDTKEVAALLAAGLARRRQGEIDTPLWHVCGSAAPRSAARDRAAAARRRRACAPRLPQRRDRAAKPPRGPFAMVELLIRRGACSGRRTRAAARSPTPSAATPPTRP